ncbi:hypothetical protein HDU99_007646, partial [Rhizoclosmatium hyalinum]
MITNCTGYKKVQIQEILLLVEEFASVWDLVNHSNDPTKGKYSWVQPTLAITVDEL